MLGPTTAAFHSIRGAVFDAGRALYLLHCGATLPAVELPPTRLFCANSFRSFRSLLLLLEGVATCMHCGACRHDPIAAQAADKLCRLNQS